MPEENKLPEGDSKHDALLASLGGSAVPDGELPLDMPKEIINDLVPQAALLFGQSLKSTSTIKAPRVAAAKWVLEQYFKMYTPSVTRREVHVYDHAAMAQIRRATKVMAEYNGYLAAQQLARRGGMDVSGN